MQEWIDILGTEKHVHGIVAGYGVGITAANLNRQFVVVVVRERAALHHKMLENAHCVCWIQSEMDLLMLRGSKTFFNVCIVQ